jgi:hypothetical protein
MLRAFIDDSGSGGNSTWYVLAGYLGTPKGWASFGSQWMEALQAHPRIGYFKASEAESLRSDGQWAGITKEQRDAKIDLLIEVIRRCARRAVCVRMRQRDYDELVKGNIPPAWDRPYYFLFTIMIGAAINIERLDGTSEPVEFVFDSDQTHERGFRAMLPELPRMQSIGGKLVNVTRADDKIALPLQAADLLAWQIRRFFSVNEPRRRHFNSAQYSLQDEPHAFVLDRPKIASVMDDMRQTATERAKDLGRSTDLRTWT